MPTPIMPSSHTSFVHCASMNADDKGDVVSQLNARITAEDGTAVARWSLTKAETGQTCHDESSSQARQRDKFVAFTA